MLNAGKLLWRASSQAREAGVTSIKTGHKKEETTRMGGLQDAAEVVANERASVRSRIFVVSQDKIIESQ